MKMLIVSSFTFGDVQVEEVAVEGSLYTASNNGNEIVESFKVETVHPVDEVHGTVCSQGK